MAVRFCLPLSSGSASHGRPVLPPMVHHLTPLWHTSRDRICSAWPPPSHSPISSAARLSKRAQLNSTKPSTHVLNIYSGSGTVLSTGNTAGNSQDVHPLVFQILSSYFLPASIALPDLKTGIMPIAPGLLCCTLNTLCLVFHLCSSLSVTSWNLHPEGNTHGWPRKEEVLLDLIMQTRRWCL